MNEIILFTVGFIPAVIACSIVFFFVAWFADKS